MTLQTKILKIFPWQKDKEFLSEEDKNSIVQALRAAEERTSGEIRVFIESRCKFVDAIDRAREIFFSLKMEETAERNATLVYVAVKDKQAAIFGDEGIHQRVGQKYWEDEVNKMLVYFKEEHLADGLSLVIFDIGQALHAHFPYDRDTDKNELPDHIVFGK